MKQNIMLVLVFLLGWSFYFFSSYDGYRKISFLYYTYRNGSEVNENGVCLRLASPWVIRSRPHEGYKYYDIMMADLNRETILLVTYDPRAETADSVLGQVDALYFQYKGRNQAMLISDELSVLFDSLVGGYFFGTDRRAIQEFSIYLAEKEVISREC